MPKGDLLPAYRFRVEMENSGAVVGHFAQCSGIKMEVETIQVRAGSDARGVQDYIPVMTRFTPVTLSKGVIGDLAFSEWLFSVAPGVSDGPKGGNPRRTLNIIALDEKSKPIITWSLKNAMPIGYELSPMDSGRSELLMESLTFAFTGLDRIIG